MKAFAVLLLAVSAATALEAAEWNKVSTPNFEVYTTAAERDARQTLQLFEQVRAFFMAVKSSKVTTRLPVTIVGFRNPKEYKPYALNEVAAAYFVGDEQRDYIVMSNMGLESSPTAIHEYMHLLVRHSGLKWPVWLNEGFAEVYSTLKPQGSQILLGAIPQGRTYSLAQEKWLSLAALFAVGHDSPEYNEKNRAGILYAESWLLTHMLSLSTGYRDKFPAFAAQVSASGSTEQAFTQVYGKSLAQVQKDLDAYYHSNSLNGVAFKTQFEKFAIGKLEPAGDLEIGLTLAKLVALNGRFDEAASRLGELATAHRDSYEVDEGLAYLEWRKGNVQAARQHFQRATERGTKNWKTYWDYARLLGGDDSKESIAALRKTLELNPDLMEARMMLGSELYRSGVYAQALITLRELKNVPPERAATVYLILAYCAMQLKMENDAKQFAEQALKYASKPGESESARQVLAYLNHKGPDVPTAGAPPAAGGVAEVSVSETRPVLRRQELDSLTPPSEAPAPDNLRLMARGRLTRLDCLEGVARIRLNADGTDYSLLIRKPDRVAIRNNLGAAVEMKCGDQSTPVAVEYTLERDEKYSTSGDVQSLEFLQQ